VVDSLASKLSVADVSKDFPILAQPVRGKRLVYLDNAASTQKPQAVLDRLMHYYRTENANVHRGVHWLSEQATLVYEQARGTVADFLGVDSDYAVVFTRGATESINLVAQAYGQLQVKAGDDIIITEMEHHSNWLPWQVLAQQRGARLRIVPLCSDGSCDLDIYAEYLSSQTALVALAHVSNTLGTVNPVKKMAIMAHEVGAVVLVDGAQAVPHQPVDMVDLDADFYVFSGHKMYAPMGIGVLVAKRQYLDKMAPYQTGGGMIRTVAHEVSTYADAPERFEAGTPNVAGAVALAEAVRYLQGIGLEQIAEHEHALLHYALGQLSQIKGVRVLGAAQDRAGIISLVMDGVHPHDLASILDMHGVAVRAGHHCTMPLMQWLKVSATLRISFGLYNHDEDVDVLCQALVKAQQLLGRRE